MDAYDLFRRLSAGAKFDVKRFKSDAAKFKIIRSKEDSLLVANKPETSTEKVQAVCAENSDTAQFDEEPSGTIKIFEKSPALEMPRVKAKKRKAESQLRLEHQALIEGIRDSKDIHVNGEDVPDPCTSFDQLGKSYNVHKDILKKIKKLGYVEPTPIQMQAVPVMLRRREILACAPTGSGKTIAFIIPILHHLKQPERKGFRALILEPTKELAKQTYQECCRISEYKKFRCHIIRKVENAKAQFGQNSAMKFDILVTTPQKLVHLLHVQPPAICLKSVEWLIIDESDKLFETGKGGFRDQLAEIYRSCDSKNVKRAMFSATFTPDVEEWCNYNLDNVITVLIGERNAAANLVQQELFFVGNEGGKLVAIRDLIKKGLNPPVLVFVQSKERAQELFQELVFDGINVEAMHAERTDLQRESIVKNFRLGKIWVLICTELMGRGIDFKGVNLVINYDFPTSAISYIHRIGRTGRAGRPGKAITFFTEDDSVLLRNIAEVMKQSGCPVPAYMLEMKPSEGNTPRWNPTRKTISTEPLYDKIKRRKQLQKARRKHFKEIAKTSHSKTRN